MKKYLILMTLTAAIFGIVSASAVEEVYPFETDAQRERFVRFTHELRCPFCQGQTLAGSDAHVAANLKKQLHQLILENKSDAEIIDFMVQRYGDFVLYKPPVQPNTYLLWFGPLVAFVIAAAVFLRIVLKQKQNDESAEP